jgi:hypothetical protein
MKVYSGVVIIKKYADYDLEKLQYVGKGMHGKVYRIDSIRCLKVFKRKETWKNELKTLKM